MNKNNFLPYALFLGLGCQAVEEDDCRFFPPPAETQMCFYEIPDQTDLAWLCLPLPPAPKITEIVIAIHPRRIEKIPFYDLPGNSWQQWLRKKFELLF